MLWWPNTKFCTAKRGINIHPNRNCDQIQIFCQHNLAIQCITLLLFMTEFSLSFIKAVWWNYQTGRSQLKLYVLKEENTNYALGNSSNIHKNIIQISQIYLHLFLSKFYFCSHEKDGERAIYNTKAISLGIGIHPIHTISPGSAHIPESCVSKIGRF